MLAVILNYFSTVYSVLWYIIFFSTLQAWSTLHLCEFHGDVLPVYVNTQFSTFPHQHICYFRYLFNQLISKNRTFGK